MLAFEDAWQGSFQEVGAELDVSRNGRRVTGRHYRPYVVLTFDCQGDKDAYVEARIRLASRHGRGVRIRRDGTFNAVRRKGRLRYRLRGRFVSPEVAQLTYSASMPPRRPRNRAHPGRCTTGHHPVVLTKDDTRLVGTYAALAQSFCPLGCGFGVQVRDLRNGRQTRDASSPGPVADLELKDNGSVAWISDPSFYPSPSEPSGRTVWADDLAGHKRLLDSGNISKPSLTLNGSTLTWRKDGVLRSATLY